MRRTALATGLLTLLLWSGAGGAIASGSAIMRSNAPAVAASLNLRHTDVPNLTQESLPITARERDLAAQESRCAGTVPLNKALAIAQSPGFLGPGHVLVVVSQAKVLPSVQLVAADTAAYKRPSELTCALETQRANIGGSIPATDYISAAHIARLSAVIAGTLRLRITLVISPRKGTTAITTANFDEIGFARGQAEVALELQSVTGAPPAALEQHLAAVLVARAKAALG